MSIKIFVLTRRVSLLPRNSPTSRSTIIFGFSVWNSVHHSTMAVSVVTLLPSLSVMTQ